MYAAAIEHVLSLVQKDPSILPRELSVFIGEMLLISMEPSYVKLWEELYTKLPGLRKEIDDNITNMINVQKRLKRKIG